MSEPVVEIEEEDDEDLCPECDESHEFGECGLDFPDPDVLYDEMNSAY